MWLVYALTTAVLWGLATVFQKRSLVTLSPIQSYFVVSVVQFGLTVPLLWILGMRLGASTVWAIVFGLVFSLANLAWIYAISKSAIALGNTVFAIYPLFTTILAVSLLHEHLGLLQLLAIGLILVGLVVVSKPSGEKLQLVQLKQSWLVWALFAALIYGSSDFLSKIFTVHLGSLQYVFGTLISSVLVGVVAARIERKTIPLKRALLNPWVVLASGCWGLVIVAFFKAFETGYASLVSSAASAYVVVAVIAAWWILKEKVRPAQVVGILTTMLGLALLPLHW